MVKLNCPYCGKKYVRPKHLETHIEAKHGKLIDLMTMPISKNDINEHDSTIVKLPENPFDMTPEIYLNLSSNQIIVWGMKLAIYGRTQRFLDDMMARCRGEVIEANPELSFEIQMKLKRLEMLEEAEAFQKVIEPIQEELRKLPLAKTGSSSLDDAIRLLKE